MFCTECGKELKPGKKFCIYCGEPVPSEYIDVQSVSDKPLQDDKTEILMDDSISNEAIDRAATKREDEGTLYLGLEADNSDQSGDAVARFSQSLENQRVVLKYKDHVIDESKVKSEKRISRKEESSGLGILIKVLIVIVILLIIAAVGLGSYYYIDSQKPGRAIHAPELSTGEDEE